MSPLYSPGRGATATGKSDSADIRRQQRLVGQHLLRLGGLDARHPERVARLRRHHVAEHEPGILRGQRVPGHLRHGPGGAPHPGTTAYFDPVTAAGVAKTMGFELCPTDGTIWLGGYDETHAASTPQYTPILTTGDNADFYSVDMTAMAIGGTNLGVRRRRRRPDRRHRHELVLHPEHCRDRADQGHQTPARVQGGVPEPDADRSDQLQLRDRRLRERGVRERPTRWSTRSCPRCR